MATHAYRTRTPTVQPPLLRAMAAGSASTKGVLDRMVAQAAEAVLAALTPQVGAPLLPAPTAFELGGDIAAIGPREGGHRAGPSFEGITMTVIPSEGMAATTIPSEAEGIRMTRMPSTPLPPLPSLTAAFSRRRAIFGPVEIEPDTDRALASSDLALARMLHARAELDGSLEQPIEQTFRSEGAGLPFVDFTDVTDVASLDLARQRHARHMASDAIDHLIALLDALDAAGADLEAVNEDGDTLDDGELDTADHEPSLGAPEVYIGHHVAMLVDQTRWHMSGCDDLELGDDNGIGDEDGLQEQFAGERYIPTLAWSVGGYVA